MEKNFTNIIMGTVIFLRGFASRNLPTTHIIVNKNCLPDLVLDNGPTQSTNTCLNGSLITGRCDSLASEIN